MRGIGILIIIVLFFWLCWPSISRWLKRKAIQKAEKYVRYKMGMPPPPPPGGSGESKRRRQNYNNHHTPIIPKEYAEDVEFIETKDFSYTESVSKNSTTENYHESQISDAEWTEIKSTKSK